MEIDWLTGLHIPSDLVPAYVLLACNLVFGAILLASARFTLWKDLAESRLQQHVYFGAIVLLLTLWGFKAGITPGLGFHHLGATLFTLMFNWPKAVLGLGLVLAASLLLQAPDWVSFGINGIFSIAVPVFTSVLILRLSWRWLPDNFFIYIFVCAFFGAALAVASSRIGAAAALYFSGAYGADILLQQSVSYLPLFMFPEAFVTGMLITIFVVYLPDWVATFDDDRYLKGK